MIEKIEQEQETEFADELVDEALDRPTMAALSAFSHDCGSVLGPKKTGVAPKKAQES